MTLQCYGRSISITEVINDLIFEYNTHSILHNKIIYDYSSLFSKNYCINNPTNVKPRFEITIKCLSQRRNEVIPKPVKSEYVQNLIKSAIPLASLFPLEPP